jgi:hypothetical protein
MCYELNAYPTILIPNPTDVDVIRRPVALILHIVRSTLDER